MHSFVPNGDFLGERPIKGICFQVFVQYNRDHPDVLKLVPSDQMGIESEPVSTVSEAYELAEHTVKYIREWFENVLIEEPDEEDETDNIVFVLVDKEDGLLAEIGVFRCDYRHETLH